MTPTLREILVDLGDFAKNRLLPFVLIVIIFVLLFKLWHGKARE